LMARGEWPKSEPIDYDTKLISHHTKGTP
jgi:hypothetical protein